MALIEVKEVMKRFGGLVALNKVSLSVKGAEIVGVIGPNGSGKTTLFNVITGIYHPDEGNISLNGTDVTGLPPHKMCRLGVGRTFQIVKPFKHLTVFENVEAAALFSKRVRNDELNKYCLELLDFVGIASQKDRLMSQVTLATAKRVEMGRALATNPEFLLLDEVLAGLNPAEIDQAIAIIRSIAKKGIGILIIEHQMKAIMSLCDRILVLQTGSKIAEGTPDEVSKDQRVITAYLGDVSHARSR